MLRLYRPLLLADFGMGVLDALVETAAYVLRSLTEAEDKQLTLSLVPEVERVPKGKKDVFSTKKYADMRDLKRHQANGELRRLQVAGVIEPVEGSFPRWKTTRAAAAQHGSVFTLASPLLVCLRLLGEADNESALREALANAQDTRRFIIAPEDFSQVPNTPFSYWVGNVTRRLFLELPPFESNGREVRLGDHPSDDFRWLRLFWEVPLDSSRRDWRSYSKGGNYSPYYSDVHLVVDWDDTRNTYRDFYGRPGRSSVKPSNYQYFFRQGLTLPRRTSRGMSVRIQPAGCVFSDKSPSIFVEAIPVWLGMLQSSIFSTLMSLQLAAADAAARSYEVGLIQRTPVPEIPEKEGGQIEKLVLELVSVKRNLDSANETSHLFQLPALLQSQGVTLAERGAAWAQHVADADSQLAANQAEIDRIAFRLYGIDESEAVNRQSSVVSEEASEADAGDVDTDEEETEQPITDHRPLTADLLSYALGCAIGRWDVRYATGAQQFELLPDPFAPLPVCAPAALTGEDKLPLTNTPDAYPLEPDWDGILADDEHHPDDIITHVRRVLDLIFGEILRSPRARSLSASRRAPFTRLLPQNHARWLLATSHQALPQKPPQSAHLLAAAIFKEILRALDLLSPPDARHALQSPHQLRRTQAAP